MNKLLNSTERQNGYVLLQNRLFLTSIDHFSEVKIDSRDTITNKHQTEKSIAKGLNDSIYEKRKAAAQQLEKYTRECLQNGDHEILEKIIDELCREYAYALDRPMARNAGLMGLAAVSIALGTKFLSKYLDTILPPVLACFGDQNDQVRFYACESLYNIAKIAKGDMLLYFNEVFDVHCKIIADTDPSIKAAAEVLDRLMKDIVSECAATHVVRVNNDPNDVPPATVTDPRTSEVLSTNEPPYEEHEAKLAFSLPKFIPLLSERIQVVDPNTRIFMVGWLQVLENIPDLELISYLPTFLSALFTYLGDSHKDVRVITHSLIDVLLHEVERVATIQKQVKDRESELLRQKQASLMDSTPIKRPEGALISERKKSLINALEGLSSNDKTLSSIETSSALDITNSEPTESLNESTENLKINNSRFGSVYIPGQDIHLDFPKIIEILVNNLTSSETEIQTVVLKWIDVCLNIDPNGFIPFLIKLLAVLLKLLNESDPTFCEMVRNVNQKLISLTQRPDVGSEGIKYGPIVNTLTLHFLDSNAITKEACLDWLILIHHKDPSQLLEHHDSTFLTLLKSLSDKDERLVAKSLELLRLLCDASPDNYFKKFIQNLLGLFKSNEKLLKTRANYIIRQLCLKLSAERVYKIVSLMLDSDDDLIFTKMIVQILSSNLVTAQELSKFRKALRKGEDWSCFCILFKTWSHNPISLLALCLISENYELAYKVLKTYVEYDLSVNDLIQIDILVQFLESPAFTTLRMQLLDPDKYPYLYKCLYGILMVLPQSKAFHILDNRLKSVGRIASHSFPNSAGYSSSSSSLGRVSSDGSGHSGSPRKHQYQDLLDHFQQVCEQHNLDGSQKKFHENNYVLLNEILSPDNTVNPVINSTPITDAMNNTLEPALSDNESVIYRSPSARSGAGERIQSVDQAK